MIDKVLEDKIYLIIGEKKITSSYSIHENHNYCEKENNEWRCVRVSGERYVIHVKNIKEAIETLKKWGDTLFTLEIRFIHETL